MLNNALLSWNTQRLRLVLIIFFIALVLPTALLINHAYKQLKWESFHQYRLQAEELLTRIDQRYRELIEIESARTFTDYSFVNIAIDTNSPYLQRSPLANYPVKAIIPGTVGYFQIDNFGAFSSPLLPTEYSEKYKISSVEKNERKNIYNKIYQVLTRNRLLALSKPATSEQSAYLTKQSDFRDQNISGGQSAEQYNLSGNSFESENGAPAQRAFDQLQSRKSVSQAKDNKLKKFSRVEDLKLEKKYPQKAIKKKYDKSKSQKKEQPSRLRKERNVLPSSVVQNETGFISNQKPQVKQNLNLRINMFESEIDSFEFSLLESGHFVLYRKVWREGQRFIQGILIDQKEFIAGVIRNIFYSSNVSSASDLTIAYQGNILSSLTSLSNEPLYSRSEELEGTLLLQNRLSTTLDQIELIFSVNNLPPGPGANLIFWLTFILSIILCSGFYILYRLGVKQITLARQQQDFVSAISHELKTPLTSIRMYGEMLREGWATEDKLKDYYNYIYDESERLTRLINNVLQLARMTRNELHVELKEFKIEQLIDTIRSKISSQVERAGFVLNLDCKEDILKNRILVDADYFIQIIINLVDNAIKFSGKSEIKKIDVSCQRLNNNKIQFSIRDYGPGVNKDQIKKIFQLFYRSGNELTRETVGTGIGLSLVKQLTHSMNGELDVFNQSPGVEFQLTFNSV